MTTEPSAAERREAVAAELPWTPHTGGSCPIDPQVMVETITRSGAVCTMRAGGIVWRYGTFIAEIMEQMPADAEVVFYRLALTPASPSTAVGAGEVRLRMFLEILAASCGQADASDNPWNWVNAFCSGHEEREPDTFNAAADAGYTTVSHDNDTDIGIVRLTDAGRAFLATAPKPASEDEPCGYCGVSPCRCDREGLCCAPGCDNTTDREICDACDQWVSDRVASDKPASEDGAALREALMSRLLIDHYYPFPWKFVAPTDENGPAYIRDRNGGSVAMMMWPAHGPDDEQRASEATYQAAILMAATASFGAPAAALAPAEQPVEVADHVPDAGNMVEIARLREAAIRAALCLSGFIGEGLDVEGIEPPEDAWCRIVDALGMGDADDDDLRAALSLDANGGGL